MTFPQPLSSSPRLPCQYRTLDRIYLIKFKNQDHALLKILDISHKCLYKTPLSKEKIAILNLPPSCTTLSAFTLTLLSEQQLLPLEHLPLSSPYPTLVQCQEAAQQALQAYKSRILAEPKELEKFTCPLTLEVFQEPVVDNHGHTFEKSAIEAHLKNSTTCPLSREPLTSLTPNRLVKQTIDSYQQQQPIPTFSLFKKDNPKLAHQYLQTAQAHLEEQEYLEALDSYTKALQYTQDWRHYISIPILFNKIQEPQKVFLAYLHLAHYQLQQNALPEAIQTLETCLEEPQAPHTVPLLLIQLYQLTHQPQKALDLSQKMAKTLSQDHPPQAILLYRQILSQDPFQFKLYEPLSQLLTSPSEKAHLLLLGACHALQAKDLSTAQHLCQQAHQYTPPAFLADLISLDRLDTPSLKEKLTFLVTHYEKHRLPDQALQAYKLLFQLDPQAPYCESIINAYETLQKTKPLTSWYLSWLTLLMKNQDWAAAERVAKILLEKSPQAEQIPLLETLETIYTHWQGHKLENLWTQLGKIQSHNGQLASAEKTYRKAYEKFHQWEHIIALADILSQQGNIALSIQTYYEATPLALLSGRLDQLDQTLLRMKAIDPSLQYLKTSERIQLLTQKTLLDLSQKLEQSYKDQQKLQQELKGAQDKIRLLEEKITAKEKQKEEAEAAIPQKKALGEAEKIQVEQAKLILGFHFGAVKWREYIGEVGDEPPLPPNILEILDSPCPIFSGKKVKETHLLTLIPQTLNGVPFNLQVLGDLVKKPLKGNATKFNGFNVGTFKDPLATTSHWVLMTRDVIPGSRNKNYSEQKTLVAQVAQKSRKPYQVPNIFDAVVSIFMEYIQSGQRLYSDHPRTYTRCQEIFKDELRLIMGCYSLGGLHLSCFHDCDAVGVSCSWKF